MLVCITSESATGTSWDMITDLAQNLGRIRTYLGYNTIERHPSGTNCSLLAAC